MKKTILILMIVFGAQKSRSLGLPEAVLQTKIFDQPKRDNKNLPIKDIEDYLFGFVAHHVSKRDAVRAKSNISQYKDMWSLFKLDYSEVLKDLESFIDYRNIAENHPDYVREKNAIKRLNLLVNQTSLFLLDKLISFEREDKLTSFKKDKVSFNFKKFAMEQPIIIKEILSTLNHSFNQIKISQKTAEKHSKEKHNSENINKLKNTKYKTPKSKKKKGTETVVSDDLKKYQEVLDKYQTIKIETQNIWREEKFNDFSKIVKLIADFEIDDNSLKLEIVEIE